MVSRPPKVFLALLLALLSLPYCGGVRRPPSTHRTKRTVTAEMLRKAEGVFIWPLQGPIYSPYGPRHGRYHDGIDIGGKKGEPFRAAADGKVVFADKLGGYGNLLILEHRNGFFTAYGHNKKNLVKKGDRVKQGQVIGKVGRTGNATTEHLHFEIRYEQATYDPLQLLPRR